MNQLNPNMLSNVELAHYAAIGAVNVLDESVVLQLAEQVTALEIDFEDAEDRCETEAEKVAELEAEVDEAENIGNNIKADLIALSDELRKLFVKYPNLKNSVPDLHEVYLRVGLPK
jgi:chromosome segregation ATPase